MGLGYLNLPKPTFFVGSYDKLYYGIYRDPTKKCGSRLDLRSIDSLCFSYVLGLTSSFSEYLFKAWASRRGHVPIHIRLQTIL